MILTVDLPFPADDITELLQEPVRWLPGADPTAATAASGAITGSLHVGGRDRAVTYDVTVEPMAVGLHVHAADPAVGDLIGELVVVERPYSSSSLDLIADVDVDGPAMLHPFQQGRGRLLAGALLDASTANIRRILEATRS